MNGMSSQFVWTNRSKESLAIDIKSSQGKEVLDALLPKADVFVQNLAPGAAERLADWAVPLDKGPSCEDKRRYLFLYLEASQPSGTLPSWLGVLYAPHSGLDDSRTVTVVLNGKALGNGGLFILKQSVSSRAFCVGGASC